MKQKIRVLNKMNKSHYLIVICLIFILSLCLLGDNDKKDSLSQSDNEDVYTLEKRLRNILRCIDGAGKVDVMITLESEGEKIILKDNKTSGEPALFSDSDDTSLEERTVMTKDGSREEPFVRKRVNAKVRGVIVCADGAYDELIKSQIVSSCVAVLDIPVTRVSVVKRKE